MSCLGWDSNPQHSTLYLYVVGSNPIQGNLSFFFENHWLLLVYAFSFMYIYMYMYIVHVHYVCVCVLAAMEG